MADPQLADVSSLIAAKDNAERALAAARDTHALEITELQRKQAEVVNDRMKSIDELKQQLATLRTSIRQHVNEAVIAWFNGKVRAAWGPITQIRRGKDEKGKDTTTEVQTTGWLVDMKPQWLADRLGELEHDLAQRLGAL